MEPGKTSFFQALGVPTKIARGTIEITADLKLVEAGAKVGASEATLLNMLNISPFTYGMKVVQVYEEGNAFSPDVLDIEESQLLKAFASAIATITSISLAANYPTLPSVIHSLVNGYKKVISAAIPIDYSWEAIDELKDRIANPDAYAAAAPTTSAAAEETADAPAAKEEEKEEEKEESEDEGTHSHFSTIMLHILISIQASVVFSTKRSSQQCPIHDTFDAVMEIPQNAYMEFSTLIKSHVHTLAQPLLTYFCFCCLTSEFLPSLCLCLDVITSTTFGKSSSSIYHYHQPRNDDQFLTPRSVNDDQKMATLNTLIFC